ncbi:hypothetical protein [Mesorhizobium sp. B2-3-5]|uniref:hypothetical protein n=1 Tax=Mesorhizobium sp. B2-3-5 TaxID=2589958 RepID=UPI00112B9C0B|nr:hypothetical protein [Mesorhizobium sp. B2-3-5]TPM19224.1 hypothetical protein FJ958_27465 [Mesorhizobium sp. B2-3-5]
MSKFKEALERGKKAHHQQEDRAGGNTPKVDFGAQARAWLGKVVIESLQEAKAEVAGEVTIDIDTTPRREAKALAPSVRFRIYKNGGLLEKNARRAFRVSVPISGEVLVSAPGMVTEDIGNIADTTDQRFRHLLAKLIEQAAKGT